MSKRNVSVGAFEHDYFASAYGGEYERRNPRYKVRAFLREITRLRPNGRLLDVGCAYGAFLQEAISHYQCYGCDISEYALSVARRRLPPTVVLFKCNAEALPVAESYDIITCFDILEHVPALKASLAGVWHALKPGGLLAFTVPVYDGLVGRLVALADHDPTHMHKCSRNFWLEKVRAAGLRVHTFKGVFRYFLARRIYINLISQPLRLLSPAIIVVAEKERP